jgi:hypothetical protein
MLFWFSFLRSLRVPGISIKNAGIFNTASGFDWLDPEAW